MGFLGRGSEPPAHQLRVWGSAVSSPAGSGAEPPENLKFGALVQLETSKFTTEMPYNV